MSKNKDKKLFSIFIVAFVVFVFVTIFSIYKIVETASSKKEKSSSSTVALLRNKENNKKKPKVDEKAKETIIKISGVGDCTLGSDSTIRGESFTSVYNKKGDDSYFLSGTFDVLSKDDLTIANLEGPLTVNGKKAVKKFSFRGSPEYTNILKKGSIEAVNLANNHSMDYGQVGFDDTMKHLEKDGIEYFGYEYKSIVEKKGVKIGLLGYKGWSQSKDVKDTIDNAIKEIKKEADIVIVSFHWGEEREQTPNSVQKNLGRHAIDSGADLVLGHHPHVIQGIEEYNGKNIVYSLGNFCFGGNSNPKDKDAYIYQQSFTFDSSRKLVKVSDYNTIPVSISSSKTRNDFRPMILSGEEKERVQNKIDIRSNLIK